MLKFSKFVALSVLLAAGATQAAGLTFNSTGSGTRTESFNSIAGLPTIPHGTVTLGGLYATTAGTVTFTYLGNESGYTNQFLSVAGASLLLESSAVGTQISKTVAGPGYLDFKFNETNNGNVVSYAVNGGSWSTGTSIGLIGTNMRVNSGGAKGSYAYIIGFNDHAGNNRSLGDWDDFVVGVNFTAAVTPVPEPETFAMLLAGLGLMGAIAARRKKTTV